MHIICLKNILAGSIVFGCIVTIIPAKAQVISDGTKTLPIPTKVTHKEGSHIFEISKGTLAKENLFHSFDVFSIPKDSVAIFINNNINVKNIINRVSGKTPSNIFGSIESGGTAPRFNLFLINPNGIIFGPEASLNIGGSFIATTANAIELGDQVLLATSKINVPSLLTVNPTAFLFNHTRPQSITISQSALEVLSGNNIMLLGGNVEIDKGVLRAPNGRIELGSMAASGRVTLNTKNSEGSFGFPEGITRGDILLTGHSEVNVLGDKGSGSIAINAQNIDLLGTSSLKAGINLGVEPDPNNLPGVIALNATQRVTFKGKDSGILNTSIVKNGCKDIDCTTVSIVTDSLVMKELSGIVTASFGNGNAGDIQLNINNELILSGAKGSDSTLIASIKSGLGNSGNISIHAGSVTLSDGANIQSTLSPESSGRSGNILIDAGNGDVRINDSSNQVSTQIRTAVLGATGDAGNITIDHARSLFLTGGGQLSAAVLEGGNGKAGNITVNTSDSVIISGTGANGFPSGIFAGSENGANGPAGNIELKTNFLNINDGGEISLGNLQGKAGTLNINANKLTLNHGIIEAETGGKGNNSADINLTISDLLRLENESLISAKAADNAKGGNITFETPLLVVFPSTGSNGSDIVAKADRGTGGNITINSQGIFGIEERKSIDGNRSNDIDASSEFGAPGQVNIDTTLDVSRGLIELPQTVVDANSLVANNACRRSVDSSFINSGRGGLPPSLSEDLNSNTSQVSLVEPALVSADNPQPKATEPPTTSLTSNSSTLVPAQGWVFNDKGEVVLVAYNSAVEGPQRLQTTPAGCPVQ